MPHSKFIKALTVIVVMAVAATAGLMVLKRKTTQSQSAASKTTVQNQQTTQPQKTTTRLIAAGDFIAHDALNKEARQNDGSYSYASFMEKIKPVLGAADIRFCSQATLVGGEQFPITGYPTFNAPSAFAKDMANAGCNLVNTASNHSSDKTQAVIDANVKLWESVPNMLAVVGQNRSDAEKKTVHYFEQDGLKYAFLAYATYSNTAPVTSYGVNMYSRTFASQQINEAKQHGAKFIIISMRWGTEYSQNVNSYQAGESQFLADQGASLILGHGPHVLEPVKYVQGVSGNNTLVWYSLGNFLHAQLEAETLFNGVAVMEIDPKTATIVSTGFLPVYMHYDWTADEAKRQNLLARKNFELVPLENAAALIKKSQLNTTIELQKNRLQTTLNTYTTVPFLTLKDLDL